VLSEENRRLENIVDKWKKQLILEVQRRIRVLGEQNNLEDLSTDNQIIETIKEKLDLDIKDWELSLLTHDAL
jgi:hypothetical protein